MTIDFALILASAALLAALSAVAFAVIGPKAARRLRNDVDDVAFALAELERRVAYRAKVENVSKARAVREQAKEAQGSVVEEANKIIASASATTTGPSSPDPITERNLLRARFLLAGNPRVQ